MAKTTSSTARQRQRPTREQTRTRVLAAAADVFSARGFTQASVDEVAGAAGLTKGAVYSSFGSKDQLFFEVLKARTAERIASIVTAARAAGEPDSPDFARGLATRLARFTTDDPTWHRAFLEFWASAMREGGTGAADLEASRRQLREAIAAELSAAGIAEAEQLAVVILALSNGLAVEGAIDPDATAGIYEFALQRLLATA